MKAFKYFMTLVLMLTMSVCFTSCGGDDEDDQAMVDNKTIIGQWYQLNDYGVLITVTFKANGSGNVNYLNGKDDRNEYFEYDYDPVERQLNVYESQLAGEYDVKVTMSYLILDAWEGGEQITYRFSRTKPNME